MGGSDACQDIGRKQMSGRGDECLSGIEFFFFFQAEDGIRDYKVTGVQTCALPICVLFLRLPTSFLPSEDQGYFFVQVQTPPGATQARTQVVLDDVTDYLRKDESRMVEGVFAVAGFNFAGRGQTQGLLFVRLKDRKSTLNSSHLVISYA